MIQEDQTRRLVAMGQMAASLAHEIRNPLGGMELFCSLLVRELKDDPKHRDIAEQILKGIRTVDRVIQNCLQFAREIIPRKSPVPDMQTYLEEVSELVRPRANDFNIPITISAAARPANSPAPEFDHFQLQQALINLISNGVDAVQERSRRTQREALPAFEPIVAVSSRTAADGELLIQISDTGEGISADNIALIFDPFMTTKTTGTGLGLAITHAIIRAHGGEIEVESTPESGTVFTIRLPQGRQAQRANHAVEQSI